MSLTPTPIPFARPWITAADREAVLRVLDGHILTHGPECKAFEAEFAHFAGPDAFAVSTSSCMASLHLACLQFGFGPGDEVIVPAQTHTATVHAVEWVGARPVFVDCDRTTGNMTPEAIAAAVTARTKGIIVVHFVGIPCDMPAIMEIAERHRLRVIEDCALAVGARIAGRHVGLFGDLGCFSFYPVKHITTGEGGMILTRHADLAEAIGKLRAFGVDRRHDERAVPGMYDVPSLGLNYRMSELQAAIGREQVKRLPANLATRAANFRALADGLGSLGLRYLDSVGDGANSHYCLTCVLAPSQDRAAVVRRLNEEGIGTSVYYPHPVPRLAYYRAKYGEDLSRFTAATEISDQSVALPVGWHIGPDQVRAIVAVMSLAVRG